MLLEGLEHVAAERIQKESEDISSAGISWMMLWIVALTMTVTGLCIVIYRLWKKVKVIEDELIEIKDNAKTDGMMIGAYGHEAQEGIRGVRNYVQRVRKGLIKASGYIDPEDVEPCEWLYWGYIQRSNKDFDLRRLDDQLQAYKEEEEANRNRSKTRIRLPSGQRVEEEGEESKELQSGEMALVQLDSGEIVNIPVEYIQPREPESEAEGEDMEVETNPHDRRDDTDVNQSWQNDPTMSQATSGSIREGQIWSLKSLDQPKQRASLELDSASCTLKRNGGERVHEMMLSSDMRHPFLDCPGFPDSRSWKGAP